ncbi:hypothetical protein SNOG_05353 [Parastagonospora nodorum SN15]|uniref:Uncharacterized protein n=1 Tax=Phaeosphaeria nodorum (strain SN15 / ATCC MYA-4574 / FGSC 10173) TaxID=321614 RepID=Q0USB1_PHANO|nr:hypothetical protein SNOG_05353 [Parastagonospora nodorum SN15]EAT87744.1 hypothetical protein SNOG_05353 [Parastagonospora nodorum SN15]
MEPWPLSGGVLMLAAAGRIAPARLKAACLPYWPRAFSKKLAHSPETRSPASLPLQRTPPLVAVRAMSQWQCTAAWDISPVAVGAASAQPSRQTPPTSRSSQGAVSPPCTLSALGRYSISVIRMPDPEGRHLFGRLLNQSPWPTSPIWPSTDQSAQHLWPAPRADNNDSSLCTSCCRLR